MLLIECFRFNRSPCPNRGCGSDGLVWDES
nr:MAG TPA: protein of unknown function (DUF4666) [Caudoviricetes sp.]DAN92585.1 MAG TPA: protein of unknown function (DUF4666) [Caudoviricetes sp.]DAR07377.1 MAG TPA: protein of unknown function (DUF4666) [Caudoviricetes sp.]DAZ10537.1 MAG TPA: protein of unknown function (DUF4666) [Caudoviricetes sp.]